MKNPLQTVLAAVGIFVLMVMFVAVDHRIHVGPGPTPTPIPSPVPDPTPIPVPVQTGLHVSAVVYFEILTPEVAAIIQSPTLAAKLTEAGHHWRFFSKTSPALAKAKLTPYVEAAGTPCLIIQTSAGKVIGGKAIPLPATEQGILDAVKAAGG